MCVCVSVCPGIAWLKLDVNFGRGILQQAVENSILPNVRVCVCVYTRVHTHTHAYLCLFSTLRLIFHSAGATCCLSCDYNPSNNAAFYIFFLFQNKMRGLTRPSSQHLLTVAAVSRRAETSVKGRRCAKPQDA